MEPTISEHDAEPRARRLPVFLRADFVYGALVTILAGVVRFVRLDIPKSLIPLDEFYYPVNALGLLRHGADYQLLKGAMLPAKRCSAVGIEPAFAVHPPIGKWLMGAGMKVFGCNSFGWRVSAALFGTLAVLVVYLIGRRLFRVPWAAGLAALLTATDGLFFIQSRIAMLDIFLAFFIVLAIWLLLEDRARTKLNAQGWRPWRIAAAVAIGLGASTKWSAAVLIPSLALLALLWDIERIRRARFLASAAAAALTAPPTEASPLPQHAAVAEPDSGTAIIDQMTEKPAEESRQPVFEAGAESNEPTMIPYAYDDETSPAESAVEVKKQRRGLLRGRLRLPTIRDPRPFLKKRVLRPTVRIVKSAGSGFVNYLPSIARIGATFALIPMAVYVLSYVPWFASGNVIKDGKPHTARYTSPGCEATQNNSKEAAASRQIKSWLCYQKEIYVFHRDLKTLDDEGKPSHPYLSRAWSWPWMGRPTSHYFKQTGSESPCGKRKLHGRTTNPVKNSGKINAALVTAKPTLKPTGKGLKPTGKQSLKPGAKATPSAPALAPIDPTRPCKQDAEILGLPNPAFWFAAFWLAIPLCFWWTIVRRDQVGAMLLLLFAPLYLPWLITTRPLFLFYMTPAVPILALMLAHAVHRAVTEFTPWRQTIFFGLLFAAPFAPLYSQWLHTGTSKQLTYKIPIIGVFVLVGMGLASLMAYTPKPKRLALAYAAMVLAVFGYFYPVLAAVTIPEDGALGWRKHMWMQQDCGQQSILLRCWI